MGADYLLMHLNDYNTFKKVLPSRVFELAAFDKPLNAGVGDCVHGFVKKIFPILLYFNHVMLWI